MNDSQYFQKSFIPCGSSKEKSQGFATALWTLQNTLVLTTFIYQENSPTNSRAASSGEDYTGKPPDQEAEVVFS